MYVTVILKVLSFNQYVLLILTLAKLLAAFDNISCSLVIIYLSQKQKTTN